MARFLSVISLTEKGLAEIKQSPARAAQFRNQVEQSGGKVVAMYWGTCAFDGFVLFDAPDGETATTWLLGLAQLGFVRTQTTQVFDEEAFAKLVERS